MWRIISVPLSFLSGTFYTTDKLPDFLQQKLKPKKGKIVKILSKNKMYFDKDLENFTNEILDIFEKYKQYWLMKSTLLILR